jgi:hypothetical protein
MKRLEFVMLLAGTAAWPVTAHGQQPAMLRSVLSAVRREWDQYSSPFRSGWPSLGYHLRQPRLRRRGPRVEKFPMADMHRFVAIAWAAELDLSGHPS